MSVVLPPLSFWRGPRSQTRTVLGWNLGAWQALEQILFEPLLQA